MDKPIKYEHTDAFDRGRLVVSDIHTLHFEQYGNPDGKPVIYLHGGPGAGTEKQDTAFFNPAVYRVILLDQRGAGKSTPLADIRENTTQHLIADIETLRSHLEITKWTMVFGGSWGSTLALAYAEAYPQMVCSVVIRGVFLGTREEFEWSELAAAAFFPELQEEFLSCLTPEERREPLLSYYKRLTSEDRATRMAAAQVWTKKELLMCSMDIGSEFVGKFQDEAWLLPAPRLEAHYFSHNCFLEKDQLLNNAHILQNIPISIVQGRMDLLCPPRWAYAVHKALPQSKLYWIDDTGHTANETGIFEKLVEVCDEYGNI